MSRSSMNRFVVLGGLIGGAFDISYAIIYSSLRGVAPERILQSVASGLLGKDAFTGGLPAAALGLFLHFFIAVVAAFVFYAASRKLAWLVQRPIAAGALFGAAMYGVMNFVVLPLSAIPFTRKYAPVGVISELAVHMFLFGCSIALCVRAGQRRSAAMA
ncbi:MAG: hypothetical protein V4463_09955 [Pseudomonadota bacterium]